MEGKQPGDPRKAAQTMIKTVESENPPLRFCWETIRFRRSNLKSKISKLILRLRENRYQDEF
jgi:hypothetical protein